MSNLVTGGSGFIGSHLVGLLRKQDESVRVLDTQRPVAPVPGVEYIQAGVDDGQSVARAMRGCKRVFHLAAMAQLWSAERRDFFRVNHEGTLTVLNAARRAGVARLVHVSSESCLIAARRGGPVQPIDEHTWPDRSALAGPYCASKWLAEAAALAAVQEHGQQIVICTPTVPVGPGDPWLTPPTRMLLGFVRRELPAWMATTLNLVDVRDVAAGLWRAAQLGEPGARYLLGGENVTMETLLALLCEISGVAMPRRKVPWALARAGASVAEWWADHVTGRCPQATVTGVRLAGARVRFDNAATRRALDWRPRALSESLRDALEDFRQRGLWSGPATGAGCE